MKTLILDNYDSFTFNLYQEIGSLGGEPFVERNDAVSIDDVKKLGVTHIVISPGPGNPYTRRDIGISEELIDFAARENIPLLGVCLGHQILGKHFGATVSRAPSVCHGKASTVRHRGNSRLFSGMRRDFEAMRYHSLRVEEQTLPSDFRVTAMTDDGVVMAMEHSVLPLYGVQFHPESIGTPSGKDILRNFLSLFPAAGISASRQRPGVAAAEVEDESLNVLLDLLLSETTPDVRRQEAFDVLVCLPITAQTLHAAALILRRHMLPAELPGRLLDSCGTGGSGLRTINTSTLTAFLIAACGGKVAKHGNRSASGNCGSFDLLEHLGVNILLTPEQERSVFSALGIVFLFAPLHHPALRFVAPLRKHYGKKTLFNLLGPLCNPASASRQLLGTGTIAQARTLSETLALLGTQRSLVVTGLDGLDEISPCAPTVIYDVPSGTKSYFLPSDLGLPASGVSEIQGGTPLQNVEIFLELAKGRGTEAQRRLVLINAAHGVQLAGIAPTLADGYALAREKLLSGAVHDLFLRYRDVSNKAL